MLLDLTAKLNRRITLADFGEIVGKAEKGRQRPYSAGAVSEWIQERNEPSIAAFVAMSKVSGRSFGWVTLGEEEEPPVLPAVQAQTESEKASAKKPSRRRRA